MIFPKVQKRVYLFLFVLFVLVLSTLPSVYFYRLYRLEQTKQADPVQIAQDDAKQIIAQVGKLLEFPSDEEPTVAKISDREKLSSQPFFARAQNGDVLLFFQKAKRAILYRPTTGKIIDISSVALEVSPTITGGATPAPASITNGRFTVFVRNGTKVAGLARTYQDILATRAPNLTVIGRGDAKTDWAQSILVDVSGTNAGVAQSLAATLGLTLSTMPKNEATTSADFLIIVGSDQRK